MTGKVLMNRLVSTGRLSVLVICFSMFGYSSGLGSNFGAEIIGDKACHECHDDLLSSFAGTVHGLANAEGSEPVVMCESCHGPGSKHAENGETEFIVNPAAEDGYSNKEYCGGCHSGVDDEFGFSHAEESGSCFDCHVVHSTKQKLLKIETPRLCYDCHQDKRAEFAMPSHHPVTENLMGCNDCHQIHGGDAKFASYDDNRELCLSCHASKQGPFIFEHEPVVEDCSTNRVYAMLHAVVRQHAYRVALVDAVIHQ